MQLTRVLHKSFIVYNYFQGKDLQKHYIPTHVFVIGYEYRYYILHNMKG